MQKAKHISVAILILAVFACLMISGCSRDQRRDKFLRSGEKYFEKGDYQSASIQFQRAVQSDPQSAEAHYRLAVTYRKLLQWQSAYMSLRKAIDLRPDYADARLEMATLEFAGRQNANARSDIDAVLNKDPNNLSAHILLGQIALTEKEYATAVQEFEKAQQIAPKNPVPFAQAGDTYLLMKRYTEAIASLQHAVEIDATYVPGYMDLAQAYRVQNDPGSELSTLLSAIQHQPTQIPPYLRIAAIYAQTGKNDRLPDLFSGLRSSTKDSPAALLSIGDFYFVNGDVLHAREALVEALQKDSSNRTVRGRLIELELNQHQWDQAQKLNDELLKQDPKDPAARLFQARIQYVRGAKAKAVSTLEELVHDSPEMALPRFYLGLAYANRGENARAVTALNEALQHDPNFIWAYLGLAELYSQQGSPKLALDFANRALAHNSNFVPALLLQADAYMQLGDYGTAVTKLQSLQAAQPKNPIILERLAVAALDQKEYQAAERELETALQLQPDYTPALVDVVKLYEIEKRSLDQVIARIQEQITRAPQKSDFYELAGDAYLAKQDRNDAQHSFEQALALNPDATTARMQLARLYAAEGNVPEALKTGQHLLEAHADYLAAYILMGSLYEQAGQFDKAEATYQQALQQDGDFAPALNNLAWLYCEHGGNLDLALSYAEKAKARMPTEPGISDTLAWIQYRKGLYSSAETLLEDATQRLPQNATYRYHLGMTLWKAGKSDEAKVALQRALQLDLTPVSAQEAKVALAQLGNSRP